MITESGGAEKVLEARALLRAFGFDAERANERSALVLLALLHLGPSDDWSAAKNPMLGTRSIMDWIDEKYARKYAPNSRETVRRFTLHQFVEALLVLQNPDDPKRPVNSPKWCYQVHSDALSVIRTFGAPEFSSLESYILKVPGLKAQYSAARDLVRIPVTLPNGEFVALSPGGQNVLIAQIIADFCAYFTPGGHVLYVGDADSKWAVFELETLSALGLSFDEHGKMPDLVVFLPDRNWLVLLEAASSHGPVDAKRRRELTELFSGTTAGLVYVSCFPSRAELRRYVADIAWETEVWCADHPTHLVHFNGERFLGPYE
jgi:type II restriction enzyme